MRSILCSFFLVALTAGAQNKSIQLKSASLGYGIYISNSEIVENGLNFNADITVGLKNQLFSLYYNIGNNVNIFGSGNIYRELNVTYGKEFKIKKWMIIEGHAGLGYMGFVESPGSSTNERTTAAIGFPVRLKLLFYIKKFAFGMNPNVNLNSLDHVVSGNIIFQYRFH